MLHHTIVIISSIFLFTACSVKLETTKSSETNKSAIEVLDKIECQCYNGIGSTEKDEPISTFEFSNNRSVSICGFKLPVSKDDELLITEFNVFDCSNGNKLVEYGADNNCMITFKSDSLKIELLKYLPSGDNWHWELSKIGEQTIKQELNTLKVSELTGNFNKTKINKAEQNDFLNSLKKGQGYGKDWEENIGRLEVLSLIGNQKAWGILKDYEVFVGEPTDGALAQTWKDAVANVKWVTGMN